MVTIKVKTERDGTMLKSQDFIFKSVINIQGKEIGFVKDIAIDFHDRKIIGLVIVSNKLYKKNIFIPVKNIISYNKFILVDGLEKKNTLKLSDIKNLNAFGCQGNVLGSVSDVIFEGSNFSIKYLVLSRGFLSNVLEGKAIININDTIEGDSSLIVKNNSKIQFLSYPLLKNEEGMIT